MPPYKFTSAQGPAGRRLPVYLLLFLFSFAAFHRTFDAGFIWFDHSLIEDNVRVKRVTPENLAHHLTSDVFNGASEPFYRPLQLVLNTLEYSAWQLRPYGYHVVNFLFHAFSACLVYELLAALSFAGGLAFFSAACLALNPLIAEQLLMVSGRSEPMCLFFTLASVLLLLRRGRLAYALALGSFALAMLSEESGVLVPFAAALCFWYRGDGGYRRLLPFLALIPAYLYLRSAAIGGGVLPAGMSGLALARETALAAPRAAFIYVFNALIPLDPYQHRIQPAYSWLNAAAFAAAAGLCAAAVVRKERGLVFALAWYVLFFAPKLPLLAFDKYMLDHWIYPSNIGLFLAVGLAAVKIAGGRGARALSAAAAAYLLFTGAAAYLNVARRDTEVKFFEHSLQYTDLPEMRYNLARDYYLAGDSAKALPYISAAYLARPGDELMAGGYSLVLLREGRVKEALAVLSPFLKGKPKFPATSENLAALLAASGDKAGAERALAAGLEYFPEDEGLKLRLAGFCLDRGEKERAAALYKSVLASNPYNAGALTDLGALAAQAGDLAAAGGLWKRARALKPGDPAIEKNLARLKMLRARAGQQGL